MEEDSSYVVKMTVQCEQAFPSLVRPDFDLVVISPGDEERLGFMEIYSSHRTIVFLKPVDKGSHSIIPQLNRRCMKRDQNPWSAIGSEVGKQKLIG